MKKLEWRIVRDSELLDSERIKIAELKNQHWPYGINSQLQWMDKNIEPSDCHLIGEEASDGKIAIRAYMTLTEILIKSDICNVAGIGIGGVCIDKSFQANGYGRILMDKAGEYITKQGKIGVLLCRKALIGFYNKCGWNIVDAGEITVAGEVYQHYVMTFPGTVHLSSTRVDVNKNF